MASKRNILGGGLLAVAMGLAAGFEGYRTLAYQDTGNVWTICYGETLGVKRGDTSTRQQCDNQLVKSLLKHNEPLTKLPHDLPDNVHLAVLDWTYNVGTGAATRSQLWKNLQAGNYPAACKQFERWRFVAGRDCSKDRSCAGVWKRRQIERDLCNGTLSPEAAIAQLGSRLGEPDKAGWQ